MKKIVIGIDVGSSSIHCGGLDLNTKEVLWCSNPHPHLGRPLETLKNVILPQIRALEAEFQIVGTALTGIGAKTIAETTPQVFYEYDSVTIPKGISMLEENPHYAFHLGAKDSYFFCFGKVMGKTVLLESNTNTKCGGGSGTLVEKQVRRLYCKTNSSNQHDQTLEALFAEAVEEATSYPDAKPYRARCGVVVQSDMIHDQNEGMPKAALIAKLFKTVAFNFAQDVIGPRQLEKDAKTIISGGLARIRPIVDQIEKITGLRITTCKHHLQVAAIGAASMSIEKNRLYVLTSTDIDRALYEAKRNRKYAPPLKDYLEKVYVYDDSRNGAKEAILLSSDPEVVIGVDGGSTTTKAVVVSLKDGKILDSLYLPTHGDPLGALKRIIKHFSRNKELYKVMGICTTGSARKLFESVLSSRAARNRFEREGFQVPDAAVDEITCHAIGIRHHDKDIDTIFEIGGQDMKFTTFKRGPYGPLDEVEEAKMNYSCQAGAGQTLENMAEILGLDVKSSLQEKALSASKTPIIDATCGVFMEIEEQRLIAENFPQEEIAAAIVRATAESYFHKFVGGSRHVGHKCSCQGGPSLGKAFLAAMAQVTGKEIHAYPGRELFGAYGAALWVRDKIIKLREKGLPVRSAFRGWNLADETFKYEEKTCLERWGKSSCGVRNCTLKIFQVSGEEIISGGFCPRGNSDVSEKPKKDYVVLFHNLLEKHFDGVLFQNIGKEKVNSPTIGIRRCGLMLGKRSVFFSAMLKQLGFTPVLTPVSDHKITELGTRFAPTEYCIAMKISAGHAALLTMNPSIDYLFMPSFIDEIDENGNKRMFCIYTEAENFVLKDALGIDKSRLVMPILHLGQKGPLAQEIARAMKAIGLSYSEKQIKEAIDHANQKVEAFMEDLAKAGDRFLSSLASDKEPGYVGLGRDYVLLDPEASSNSGHLFTQVRGMHYIPQPFLRHKYKDIDIDKLVENEYWAQSAEILKASIYTSQTHNLYPIRLMNFACGPDSIKFMMESEIFKTSSKPFLHLMTDAQVNNAPFSTRAEAHHRVVSLHFNSDRKSQKQRTSLLFTFKGTKVTKGTDRTWLIPYMGKVSSLAAAAAEKWGIKAAVVPTNTPESLETAGKFISMETCFPLRGVVGDIMATLLKLEAEKGPRKVQDEYLIFLPTTSGPCRFGKYSEVLKLILRQVGLGEIPIVSPSSSRGYLDFDKLGLDLSSFDRLRLAADIYDAILVSDLFDDLILRFRPYAKDKEAFNELSLQRFNSLKDILAGRTSGKDVCQWLMETAKTMAEFPKKQKERFPLVLYVGEIYMRQHDPYTGNIVERLEEEGLELVRSPVHEWLEYVTFLAWEKGRKPLNLLAEAYMRFANGKFKRTIQSYLKERHVLSPPREILSRTEAEEVYHSDIMGESALSIGIFNEFIKGRLGGHRPPICGIFHVGPFTCMQEGISSAKIRAMIKEFQKGNREEVIPVINAFFGESPNPNLEAEIASFRESCYLRAQLTNP